MVTGHSNVLEGWDWAWLVGYTHTYPTDSARALVDSSDTKTWQANRWSAGCLVMNPKYLQEGRQQSGWDGAQTPPGTLAGPRLATMAPDPQLTPRSLSHPTYLLFFGWYPQKEMFFNWKKWLHLFPYRKERRRGWASACRGHRWEIWWESRGGANMVTLASWESSALTPIFTPLTLISRTQLEGGLKCTVSRRVVAICGRGTGM